MTIDLKLSDADISTHSKRKGACLDVTDWTWIGPLLDEVRQRRMYEQLAMRPYDPLASHKLVEKSCSVTAYDMKLTVCRDGRERGLWFQLRDKMRTSVYSNYFTDAVTEWVNKIGVTKGTDRLRAMMDTDSFKYLSRVEVRESALLEWPQLKEIYKALGAEIAKTLKKTKTKKGRRK